MKHRTETFLNTMTEAVQGVRMEPHAREAIRERLLAYADLHTPEPVATAPVRSPLSYLLVYRMQIARAFVALLLVLGVSGGAAYASEGSLPGEPLYALKTSVVEPLEGAFLFRHESRAAWQAILAERRLVEAATLASKGALTPEIRADLEARFLAHVDKAEAAAAMVEADGDIHGALALRSDIEARLTADADILGEVALALTAGGSHEAGILHTSVNERRLAMTQKRQDLEARVKLAQVDADAVANAAAATEEVARVASTLGASDSPEVRDRIEGARTALDSARTALADSDEGAAFVATQDAARLAQEAATLAKNQALIATAPIATTSAATSTATTTPEAKDKEKKEEKESSFTEESSQDSQNSIINLPEVEVPDLQDFGL